MLHSSEMTCSGELCRLVGTDPYCYIYCCWSSCCLGDPLQNSPCLFFEEVTPTRTRRRSTRTKGWV